MKTLLATAFMWAAGKMVMIAMSGLPGGKLFDVLRLAAVVPTAAATYVLAAKVLHIRALSVLTGGTRD
jgi:hypothetical protein